MLTEAIEYRRSNLIKKILEMDISLEKLGVGTDNGTPAHFCLKNLFLEIVFFKQMLAKGVCTNSLDSHGRTGLHLAFSCFGRDQARYEQVCDVFMKNG